MKLFITATFFHKKCLYWSSDLQMFVYGQFQWQLMKKAKWEPNENPTFYWCQIQAISLYFHKLDY